MRRALMSLSLFGMLGCATTYPTVTAPIPDDIGWRAPQVEEMPAPEPMAPPVRPATAFEKVYAYAPGEEYVVDVAVGFPQTLQLQPGERVYDKIHGDRAPLSEGDDTPPWDVKETMAMPPEPPHLLIVATKAGLTNGLTVITDKRAYLIRLRSVAKSRVRLVRWTYDAPLVQAKAQAPRLWPSASTPQAYHVGYWIAADGALPTWMPHQALDDGHKTYILFPVNLTVMPAPMIRAIGPNGPELLNVRLVGSVMVLDHLISHGVELRLGSGPQAETVRITRQAPRTIACPGNAACPVWPAQRYAAR